MAARILRNLLSKTLEHNAKLLSVGCLQNVILRPQSAFHAAQLLAPTASASSITFRTYCKMGRKKSTREYMSDSESDSDTEDRKFVRDRERGTTEFWRQKMRTIHAILDINNDGVISYDDFKLLVDKFSSLGHLSSQDIEEFTNTIKKTWEEQFGEVTVYNLVTAEQYLNEMRHRLNDKEQSRRIHLFLPYLFKAVNKDKSGYISLGEYKLFFKCLGLSEDDAAISFACIDRNNDGKLSQKEFVKLGREYFFSEDEKHISKLFWGPLAH